MKLTSQSHNDIVSSLLEAFNNFIDLDACVITDIHLQPKQDSGELVIYNDDDEEISRTVVEEWVDNNDEDFYKNVENILKSILNELKENGKLDKLCIIKPFSFVLVDDDKETICDLLLVDDDTLFLDNELLKGLDEELDDFLKKILE